MDETDLVVVITEQGENRNPCEERLRFTFRVVRTLQTSDPPALVQAWLTGLNPELDDRVPVRMLRDGDLEKVAPEILGAVRAFLAGG
jgi:hypothetical protein